MVLIQTRNTKGSTENIPLLEAGELDLALVTGEPFFEAINGIGRSKAQLRIITAMYSCRACSLRAAIRPTAVLPIYSANRLRSVPRDRAS